MLLKHSRGTWPLFLGLLLNIASNTNARTIYYNATYNSECTLNGCFFSDARIWANNTVPSSNDTAIISTASTTHIIVNDTVSVAGIVLNYAQLEVTGKLYADTISSLSIGFLNAEGTVYSSSIEMEQGGTISITGRLFAPTVNIRNLIIDNGSLSAYNITADLIIAYDAAAFPLLKRLTITGYAMFDGVSAFSAQVLTLYPYAKVTFSGSSSSISEVSLYHNSTILYDGASQTSHTVERFSAIQSGGNVLASNVQLQINAGSINSLTLAGNASIILGGPGVSPTNSIFVQTIKQYAILSCANISVHLNFSVASTYQPIAANVSVYENSTLHILGPVSFNASGIISGRGVLSIHSQASLSYPSDLTIDHMNIDSSILNAKSLTVLSMDVYGSSNIEGDVHVMKFVMFDQLSNLTITGDYSQSNETLVVANFNSHISSPLLNIRGGAMRINGKLSSSLTSFQNDDSQVIKIPFARSYSHDISGTFTSVRDERRGDDVVVSVEISSDSSCIYIVYTPNSGIRQFVGEWKWAIVAVIGFLIVALISFVIWRKYKRQPQNYFPL